MFEFSNHHCKVRCKWRGRKSSQDKMFQLNSQNPWVKSKKSLAEKVDEDAKFSFRAELYYFLNNTVCHCYRHLAQVDRSTLERWMWGLIHMFGAGSLIFLTTTSYQSFVLNPLITTLHDTVYPIKYIPFPAVTVCSNNRISKRAAVAFAKELWVSISLNKFLITYFEIDYQQLYKKRQGWYYEPFRHLLFERTNLSRKNLRLWNWKWTSCDRISAIFGSSRHKRSIKRNSKHELCKHHSKGRRKYSAIHLFFKYLIPVDTEVRGSFDKMRLQKQRIQSMLGCLPLGCCWALTWDFHLFSFQISSTPPLIIQWLIYFTFYYFSHLSAWCHIRWWNRDEILGGTAARLTTIREMTRIHCKYLYVIL